MVFVCFSSGISSEHNGKWKRECMFVASLVGIVGSVLVVVRVLDLVVAMLP